MRVLIVDDEAPARRRLAMMLDEIGGVIVVGEGTNGTEALALADALRPDLVLLDIEMPDRDGIEVAAALAAGKPPIVIFVTAFDHYAVRAFDHAAIDYLLKPVALQRMEAALSRARAALQSRRAEGRATELAEVIATLRQSRSVARPQHEPYLRELWVQRNGERVRIEVDRIDWIEAEHDYVRLHLAQGAWLLRQRIGDLAALLDPKLFVRVHRSAIVRRNAIHSIRQAGFGALAVVLTNGVEQRVGRKYAAEVRGLTSVPTAPG